MTSLFIGSALCEVDPEGRVHIPDFVIEGLGGEELLVGKQEGEPCLVGYQRRHFKRLYGRAERRRRLGERRGEAPRAHRGRMRRTFGLVERMPRAEDALCLPPAMRHLGHIGRFALFVGTGDSFEIWDPGLAAENADEQFRELAAYRMDARDEDARGSDQS